MSEIVPSVAVFKTFRLYCAHSITAFGPDHKCSKKHGHTYRVRVEAHQAVDSDTLIAIPFEKIEQAWREVGEPLDHTDLNEKFGHNPTTEVVAMYLQGQMSIRLGCDCTVEVQETESSGVIIRARGSV